MLTNGSQTVALWSFYSALGEVFIKRNNSFDTQHEILNAKVFVG
jgi:hypothetical protein